MAGIGEYIYNTFAAALQGALPNMSTSAEPEASLVDVRYESNRYTPSVEDVLKAKAILFHKLSLPLELVDTVIDFAEYWPRTVTSRSGGQLNIQAGSERENTLILRSYPLGYLPTQEDVMDVSMLAKEYPTIEPEPWAYDDDFSSGATEEVKKHWQKESQIRGEYPCRKIVFKIKSHDQGWGGNREHKGTYKGSYTWFEAGKETVTVVRENEKGAESLPHLSVASQQGDSSSNSNPVVYALRTVSPTTNSRRGDGSPPEIEYYFQHNLNPSSDSIQRNKTAWKGLEEHEITWSCDDNINPESMAAKALEEIGRGGASATGEYVRGLKIGDAITVWAKARFPGWCNIIEEVRIEVYWAV